MTTVHPSDRRRLRAIELARKGRITPAQISERLNINNPTRVRRWLEAEGVAIYEPPEPGAQRRSSRSSS